MMDIQQQWEDPLFEKHFRVAVEAIFNNWPSLRLAVEHGMGGRFGHEVKQTINRNISNVE